MKRCLLILFLLQSFWSTLVAQTNADSAFQLNDLPKDGLLLNSGWTFHPGDDFAYANYDYEGQEGIPVKPATVFGDLPTVKTSGIGWFRLRLQVDSSLRNQTIGMMLSLFGAAEIYLNGRLIYRFGAVSENYKQEKTQAVYGRAFTLPLNGDEKQILAVRYSLQKENLYVNTGVIPYCLQIILLPLNQIIDHYALLVKDAYQFIGVALTIELASALLTLFFFFSFRSRKEYLYFGLYFAFNFFGVLSQSDPGGVGKEVQLTVNQLAFVQILVYACFITGSLFHLNAMYALLHIKRTRFYKFLFLYAIISIGSLPLTSAWRSVLPNLFFPLACLEFLPVYYKAARRGFRGAWVLFTSILICFIFLIGLVKVNLEMDTGAILVLTALALFTPAAGIVLFLAVDFARTSQALKARVVEVEKLSQKTLAQERDKQEILAAQKDKLEHEVENRTAELSKSLSDLKATQAQLIQSEKMASLGELTAGVAHEIQNPLNFVNNFSEVSKELMDELMTSLQNDDKGEALSIASGIKDNLQKIEHHGKRADDIVKSMLQHSRKSSGAKELTDINALTDEYLRLSYYGLRAKNHGLNADYVTNLDETIGPVQVIQQDIGRVLMNLFNNAFYAIHQKKILLNGTYEPMVTVSTKKKKDAVEISVKDNGNGISPDIIDKIFQPFFTTKPAGQGTGLGLSLSYDIVTKGHGGKIKVNSKEGEGAEFIIELPVQSEPA